MNNIKVPGNVWVVLIALAFGLVHRYVDDPLLYELVLAAIFIIAKWLAPGTNDVETLLEILGRGRLRAGTPSPEADVQPLPKMRSAGVEGGLAMPNTARAVLLTPEEIQEAESLKPNRFARVLFG